MDREQAVAAPVPGVELGPDLVGKRGLADQLHRRRRVDRAGHEAPRREAPAVGQLDTDGAAALHPDLTHLGVGLDVPTTRLDQAGERLRQRRGATDGHGQPCDVGHGGGEEQAGARLVLRRRHVHEELEEALHAMILEVAIHRVEEGERRVAEQIGALRAGQPRAQLGRGQRRVVEQRREERPHRLRPRRMQVAVGLGVVAREAGERGARPLHVLVDDDAGAVAERRPLLDGRLDVGKAEAPQLQVTQERRVLEPDVEVRVQVEAKARDDRLVGRAAAADPRVAFEDERPLPGPHHVRGQREAVVAAADHDAVEHPRRHRSIPRWRAMRSGCASSSAGVPAHVTRPVAITYT